MIGSVSGQRSTSDPTAGRGGGKRVAIEGSCSDVLVRARKKLVLVGQLDNSSFSLCSLRGLLAAMMQCNVTKATASVGVLATVDDGKDSGTSLKGFGTNSDGKG